jgi:hypothetical protein
LALLSEFFFGQHGHWDCNASRLPHRSATLQGAIGAKALIAKDACTVDARKGYRLAFPLATVSFLLAMIIGVLAFAGTAGCVSGGGCGQAETGALGITALFWYSKILFALSPVSLVTGIVLYRRARRAAKAGSDNLPTSDR